MEPFIGAILFYLYPENSWVWQNGESSRYRGTSLIRITPPLGSPKDPRHRDTLRSYGGGDSYERGTPAHWNVGNVNSSHTKY